jgi:hypothetical protein
MFVYSVYLLRIKLLHQLKETGVYHQKRLSIIIHQYYNQVVLDVKRILECFPPGSNNISFMYIFYS